MFFFLLLREGKEKGKNKTSKPHIQNFYPPTFSGLRPQSREGAGAERGGQGSGRGWTSPGLKPPGPWAHRVVFQCHTLHAAFALLPRRVLSAPQGPWALETLPSLLGTGMGKAGRVCVRACVRACAKQCPGCPAGGLGWWGCFLVRTGDRWEQGWGAPEAWSPFQQDSRGVGGGASGAQRHLPCPWCQSLWARGPPGQLGPSSAHPKPGERGGLGTRASRRAGGDPQGRCRPTLTGPRLPSLLLSGLAQRASRLGSLATFLRAEVVRTNYPISWLARGPGSCLGRQVQLGVQTPGSFRDRKSVV